MRILENRLVFDGAFAIDVFDTAEKQDISAIAYDDIESAGELTLTARTEVAVVDTSIEGYQDIVDGLAHDVTVILIDGSADGWAQLEAALNDMSSIDALHIFGHGADGAISLGGATLNADTLGEYTATLQQIGAALTASGDILFYHCDVAAGDAGETLIRQIAQLTAADVAASDDATGAAELGGDWDLEIKVGAVDTKPFEVEGYANTLALVSTFEVTDTPSATPLTVPAGETIEVGLYYPNASNSSYLGDLKTFYDNQPGFSTSSITESFSTYVPQQDFLIVFQPKVNFTSAEIATLSAYLDRGGRIFFVGEHNGYKPTENANITSIISNLGGAIGVLGGTFNDYEHNNTTGPVTNYHYGYTNEANDAVRELNNHPINSGVSSFQTAAFAQLEIDPDISEAVVVDNYNRIVVADQAISKGRVTLIADQNWLDGIATNARNDDNDIFLTNVAINSYQNIKIVEAGGNPNAGFGINASSGIDEDTDNSFSASDFKVAGADANAIKIITAPDNGSLYYNDQLIDFSAIGAAPGGNIVTDANSDGSNDYVNTSFDASKLRFTPNANYNGSVTFTWLGSTDGGATYTSSPASVTINIVPVNDDPTATGVPTSLTVIEDTQTDVDLSSVTLADVDAASSDISLTLTAGAGTMTATSGGGVTVAGSGTSTVTLTGTVAELNTFIADAAAVKFTPAANTNGAASTTISLVLNDGGNTGDGGGADVSVGTISVDITAVNDAPIVTKNTGVTMDEGAQVTITSAMLSASDVDDADLTYTITTAPTEGQLYRDANGDGVIDAAEVLNLNDTFTQADINAGLIKYSHGGYEATSDSFGFSVADGGEDGAAAATGTFDFTITAQNDDPTVSGLPTSITIVEDTPTDLYFDTIALSDVDAFGSSVTVTLDVGLGTFTASSGGGVTVSGSGTSSLSLSGSVSALNAFVSTSGNMSYTPPLNQFGTDLTSITVTANDNGNTGAGGGTDVSLGTITVTVTEVNDAPLIDANNGATLDEAAQATVTSAMLASSDVDDVSLTYTVTTATTEGTLYRDANGDGVVDAGEALGVDGTFTQADIDAGLIKYAHAGDEGTSDSFGFSVADGGEDDAAPATGTFNFTITPVDDITELAVGDENAGYTEDDAPMSIAPNLTITDPDALKFSRATIELTNAKAGDVIAFVNDGATMGNIAVASAFNGTTGIFILESAGGTATAEQWQAALRAVTYASTSQDPDETPRDINIHLGNAISLKFDADGDTIDENHFYEYVADPGISWDDAKAAAENSTLNGLQGYLATITTAGENSLIAEKLKGNAWIGASDANRTWTRADGSTFTTVEGQWTWVTGPEAGTQFWQDDTNNTDKQTETFQGSAVNSEYQNWNTGEPNDYNGNEDYAHLYSSSGKWNDFPGTANVAGYVIEYNDAAAEASFSVSTQVKVTAVNDDPIITIPANVTIDENSNPADVLVDFAHTDVEGDSVTWTISGDDADFFTIEPATGKLRFAGTPDFETQSSYTVTVSATDADGGTDSHDIAISLTDLNEGPVVIAQTPASVNENADKANIIADFDAYDDDGDTVTWSISGTDAGAFEIDPATGELRFVASPDFETKSSYSVDVRATDPDGLYDTKTLSVSVNDVNEVPSFVQPNTVFIAETEGVDSFDPKTGAFIASDADADATLSYAIKSGDETTVSTLAGTYGTLSVNATTGAYTYVPNDAVINSLAGADTDTFDIVVTDNEGLSVVRTLTIDVQAVNDAPIFGGPVAEITYVENTAPVVINPDIELTDAEAQSYDAGYLQVAITGNGSATDQLRVLNRGGIAVDGTNVTFAGTVIGTIDTAFDGQDGRALRINLADTAFAPQTEALARAIAYLNSSDNPSDAAKSIEFTLFDGGDGGTLTPRFSSAGASVTVIPVNDKPEISFDGDAWVTEKTDANPTGEFALRNISLDDAENDVLTVTFKVKSDETNGDYGSLTFRTDVAGGVTADQFDAGTGSSGGTVTITATAAQINATLAAMNGVLYTPADGIDYIDPGADFLTITAVDGQGGTLTLAREILVAPKVPNADSDNVVTEEDTAITIHVESLVQTINQNVGEYVYGTGTPDDADAGTTGSITAFGAGSAIYSGADQDLDGDGQFGDEVVGFTLVDDKDPSIVAGELRYLDPTLYYEAANNEASFVFTPDLNYEGSTQFVYRYDETGVASSNIAIVRIFVTPVNDAPTLDLPDTDVLLPEDGTIRFASDEAQQIVLGDTDARGGALMDLTLEVGSGTLDLATLENIEIIEGANGSAYVTIRGDIDALKAAVEGLVYAPNGDYNGGDAVKVTLSDFGEAGAGGAKTTTSTIALDVAPVNDLPVFADVEPVVFTQDGPEDYKKSVEGSIAVSADVDTGDTLSYGILVDGELVNTVTTPYGTLTIDPVTGQYTFDPNEAAMFALTEDVIQEFTLVVRDDADPETFVETTLSFSVQGKPFVITKDLSPEEMAATLALYDGDDAQLDLTGLSTAQIEVIVEYLDKFRESDVAFLAPAPAPAPSAPATSGSGTGSTGTGDAFSPTVTSPGVVTTLAGTEGNDSGSSLGVGSLATDTTVVEQAAGTGISGASGLPDISSFSAGGSGAQLIVNLPSLNYAISSNVIDVTIPKDTFSAITADGSEAAFNLGASQINGDPLPSWLNFNPETGKFTGTVPAGERGQLRILLKAIDANGNEVTSTILLNLDDIGGDVEADPAPADEAQLYDLDMFRPGQADQTTIEWAELDAMFGTGETPANQAKPAGLRAQLATA